MPRTSLDRTRDFGEVFGGHVIWKYEQDWKCFDAEGIEMAGHKALEGDEPKERESKQKRKGA